MKTFFEQLKWQLILLQKNNIITISIVLTVIYGALFYLLKDAANIDTALIFMVLNDPSIIGYFFIALAIFTEMKLNILPAIFVSPLKLHQYLIPKTIALSLIGLLCALLLAFFVKGFDFDILNYSIGTFGICVLTCFLSLSLMTFSTEFLKFAMLSLPAFLLFMIVPLLQYIGLIDLGLSKYIFPVQSSIDLLEYSVSGKSINIIFSYAQLAVWIIVLYLIAFKMFSNKIVHR